MAALKFCTDLARARSLSLSAGTFVPLPLLVSLGVDCRGLVNDYTETLLSEASELSRSVLYRCPADVTLVALLRASQGKTGVTWFQSTSHLRREGRVAHATHFFFFYYDCMNGFELFTCSWLGVLEIKINLAAVTNSMNRLSHSNTGAGSFTKARI